jgi:glycosyltransferase involved in cell wall biosynthesis
MRFKIVSVGWMCSQFIEQTLRSVEMQSVDNWDIWITYDPSQDDGAAVIKDWCDARDDRWNYTINTDHRWAVRNQYETITALAPKDDDVVVFLDLDGDQFAHADVLARLAEEYQDGTLLTYGNYLPVPFAATCPLAIPFPSAVINHATYRVHMLTGQCCFNHLRTMSGRVFKAIPENQCRWESGEWYVAGTDYVFMVAGLELAGERHKCLSEVLLLYNNANPRADNLTHPAESDACVQNYLHRPSLKRLP